MKEAPQALAEAIRAQRKFPDHPVIQYLFALASYQVSESPLGPVALRNLRSADPASPRVLLAEGLLHRKEGRTAEAARAFVQAARRGLPDARLLWASCTRRTEISLPRRREFREAERLDPRNGQVSLELGRLFLSRGQLAEAKLRLERAVLSMPDFPAVHYQLGLLYRKLDRTERADTHFKRYRELAGEGR